MDDAKKAPPTANVASLHNISKTYGSKHALQDVSLELNPGEVVGLLGPNGAGKTTLMRVMLGLVRPTSGTARVLGAEPGSRESLRRLGATIEGPAFAPNMSGRDCLRMAARAKGLPDSSIDAVLARVDLTDAASRKFKTYSMGMKQRLALAQAMLGDPELLVIDEPMNGLDPRGVVEMRELMRDIASDGRTVLVSSHQLHEIQLVCSRIVVLNDGRKLADERLDSITDDLEEHFFNLLANDKEMAR